MQRHPEIKEKMTTNMEHKRLEALSLGRIENFYKGFVCPSRLQG